MNSIERQVVSINDNVEMDSDFTVIPTPANVTAEGEGKEILMGLRVLVGPIEGQWRVEVNEVIEYGSMDLIRKSRLTVRSAAETGHRLQD